MTAAEVRRLVEDNGLADAVLAEVDDAPRLPVGAADLLRDFAALLRPDARRGPCQGPNPTDALSTTAGTTSRRRADR